MSDNKPDQLKSQRTAKDAIGRLKQIEDVLRKVVSGEMTDQGMLKEYGAIFPELRTLYSPPSQDEIDNIKNHKLSPQADFTKKAESSPRTIAEIKWRRNQRAIEEQNQKEQRDITQAEINSAALKGQIEKYDRRYQMLINIKEKLRPLRNEFRGHVSTFRHYPFWFGRALQLNRSSRSTNPVIVANLGMNFDGRKRTIIEARAGRQEYRVINETRKYVPGNGQDSGYSIWSGDMSVETFGKEKFAPDPKTPGALFLNEQDLLEYMMRRYDQALRVSSKEAPLRLAVVGIPTLAIGFCLNWVFGIDDIVKDKYKDIKNWGQEKIQNSSFGNIFDEHSSIIKTPDGQLYTTAPDDTSPEV